MKTIIEEISASYDVNTSRREVSPQQYFFDISDAHKDLPQLSLQFLDDKLYAVYFAGNQFFELTDADLNLVARQILDGNYNVKITGIFRKKHRVRIDNGVGNTLLAERITSFKNRSTTLPLPAGFTLKTMEALK